MLTGNGFQGVGQGSHFLGRRREGGGRQRDTQDDEILKNLPCHWFIFC
jgi:hypothetical protein